MSVAESPTSPEACELLSELLIIKHNIAILKEREAALLDDLFGLYELGKIPDKFEHAGHSVYLNPGRKTYEYPGDIIELEAALMEAKAIAVAAERATLKPSAPCWTVRKIRAKEVAA